VPGRLLKSPHALPIAVLGVIVAGVSVAIALLINWLPDAASKEADRVDALIWWTVFASIFIFTIVLTFLLYSVWKFRAAPGDEEDGPPLHGNTKLEVIWTAIPTIMLLITAIWAALVLHKNEALAAPADRMQIDVTAQQFLWQFTYPGTGVTTGDLRVPAGTQIQLRLHAVDVIHDFFVFETRIKGDAVPGITNTQVRFTMKPETAGRTYAIVCAELCGIGHAVMRSRMVVMSPGAFRAWLQQAQAAVKAGG
jgi:cytochrome c oxidase subunit II